MEVLRSKRLLLRHLEPADRHEVVMMFQAGQRVERWSPPLAGGTTVGQMFDGWFCEKSDRHARFVTEPLDTDGQPPVANLISFTEIVRGVFQSAFIGWRTHPALLERGYGTDSLRLSLQHAFADDGLGLHRVQAPILPDNIASRRVAEKCGFRFEGVARRYLYIRNQWRDHLVFAITADEFTAGDAVPALTKYWHRFLRAREWAAAPPATFAAFQFGDRPQMADKLAALVNGPRGG